jgi:hypothetical protein
VYGAEYLAVTGMVQEEPEPTEPKRPGNVIEGQDTPGAQEDARKKLARHLAEGRILSDHFILARGIADDRPFHIRANGLALLHRQTGLAAVITDFSRHRQGHNSPRAGNREWRAPLAAWRTLVDRLEALGGPSGLWESAGMDALSSAQERALEASGQIARDWREEHQPED